MIPTLNVVAWSQIAPWAEPRQIEQDLIISRAIVELFSDPVLADNLRFRGGTALNKLHFPQALRYSEDIDLVRTSTGPIGPILDRIRELLQPWLGQANYAASAVAPKLRFRVPAEDNPELLIRLKVEINTNEITAYDEPIVIPYSVDNPWFSGQADIATFSNEEMLATKLRALLQRDKGRDLFDLVRALDVFESLDRQKTVKCLGQYLAQADQQITRAQAEQRVFAKMTQPTYLSDTRPLLSPDEAEALDDEATRGAFARLLTEFIAHFPGEPWARSAELADQFGINAYPDSD